MGWKNPPTLEYRDGVQGGRRNNRGKKKGENEKRKGIKKKMKERWKGKNIKRKNSKLRVFLEDSLWLGVVWIDSLWVGVQAR